jgi:hypothetical protein
MFLNDGQLIVPTSNKNRSQWNGRTILRRDQVIVHLIVAGICGGLRVNSSEAAI